MLALRANRTVSADELIDGLWGDRPPASAAKNLQSYVSQLRKALASDGAGAEHRHPRSRLRAPAGRRTRSTRCASSTWSRRPLASRAGAGANGLAGAALELWRGAPLADVASEPFAGPEIGRLEELHLRAIELAIDAELAAGRHAEAIARLEALIAEEPLRERLHAQRMLALYRDGRQSEALEAYREARAALIEQIGVEPGPELQAPAGADPRPGPGPRRAAADRRAAGPARGRLAAARRTRARARLAAQALGAGARGPGRLRDGLGAGGDRQDAARGRARGRGPARGRRGPLRRRWRGRRGGAGDRRRGRHGPPTDAAGARLRRRRPPERARGRRGARPRARGPAAHGLRPSSRRAGPARLRRPARERRRPAPAARPAARGRGGRDRRALRARRGRRDAAARR